MEKNGISVWESLVCNDLTIKDKVNISINEFNEVINSLNLNLSLKDQLVVIGLCDPNKTGLCDLEEFITLFETTDPRKFSK